MDTQYRDKIREFYSGDQVVCAMLIDAITLLESETSIVLSKIECIDCSIIQILKLFFASARMSTDFVVISSTDIKESQRTHGYCNATLLHSLVSERFRERRYKRRSRYR